jgi:hypothetical protein
MRRICSSPTLEPANNLIKARFTFDFERLATVAGHSHSLLDTEDRAKREEQGTRFELDSQTAKYITGFKKRKVQSPCCDALFTTCTVYT